VVMEELGNLGIGDGVILVGAEGGEVGAEFDEYAVEMGGGSNEVSWQGVGVMCQSKRAIQWLPTEVMVLLTSLMEQRGRILMQVMLRSCCRKWEWLRHWIWVEKGFGEKLRGFLERSRFKTAVEVDDKCRVYVGRRERQSRSPRNLNGGCQSRSPRNLNRGKCYSFECHLSSQLAK
jgi:hypothetical protein